MSPLSIRAVRPRKPPIAVTNIEALIKQQLGEAGFAGAAIRDLADYPTALPWKSRVPTKGPRKGGRRTGDLGRGWKLTPIQRRNGGFQILVYNDIPYAVHVEGPLRGAKGERQTQEMRRRNWPSVTTVANARKRQYRIATVRILTQRDARLR